GRGRISRSRMSGCILWQVAPTRYSPSRANRVGDSHANRKRREVSGHLPNQCRFAAKMFGTASDVQHQRFRRTEVVDSDQRTVTLTMFGEPFQKFPVSRRIMFDQVESLMS